MFARLANNGIFNKNQGSFISEKKTQILKYILNTLLLIFAFRILIKNIKLSIGVQKQFKKLNKNK